MALSKTMAQQDTKIKETTPANSTWDIDPTHSTVEFSVKHLMFSTVRGRFREFAGSLHVDDADPASAHVEVDIEAASIDTGTNDRDTHLRSADFFAAEEHPKLSFRSSQVDLVDEDHAKVTGDLTIRGNTQQVVLDVTREGTGRDPWGNTRTAYSAEGTIDREGFGLKWNQLLETGGVLVGSKVRLHIAVQVVRRITT